MTNPPSEPNPPEHADTFATGFARTPSPASEAPLPASIGPYRILGKLGEGGMGIVYEAEQRSPKRLVALKVIRSGHFMDETNVRLFRREVEVLARLKHPGIAAVYDAGITETGEHFFAMELVRGATLDVFLNARSQAMNDSEVRFRLRLLRSVCEAVNYAHQRGVIHRDLKPTNIIVPDVDEGSAAGEMPAVKILDFGLARLTESDVHATAATEVGVIKGTLPYMSPEQARGESSELDIRTDVYSLGTVLYETLTGKLPHVLDGKSMIEALRAICEESPVPLRRAWRGPGGLDPDVDTIVGKALQKDVVQRYASAAALGEDIDRYLAARPILARAPSTIYLARKFVRRNRGLVVSMAATLLVLVAGIVASATFGVREGRQRRDAERARQETESVVDFQQKMLADIDPNRMGRALTEDLRARLAAGFKQRGMEAGAIRRSLDSFDAEMKAINPTDAALRVIDQNILRLSLVAADAQFPKEPMIRARLQHSIGATYMSLGLYDQAGPPLLAARATYDSLRGRESGPSMDVATDLANVYHYQGDYAKAEPLKRRLLAVRRRDLPADDPKVWLAMNDLALLCDDMGKPAEAESLYALTLPGMIRARGEADRQTIAAMSNYAWMLTNAGKFARAESLGVRALALRRSLLGNENAETMQSVNNLAVLYKRTGRLKEAEALYLEDYQTSRRLVGAEHPEMLATMANLGRLYMAEKKYAEAEQILGEARTMARKNMPPGFMGTGIIDQSYGELMIELRRFPEAEAPLLESYGIVAPALGKDSPGAVRCAGSLVKLYEETGRPGKAAAWKARAKPGA